MLFLSSFVLILLLGFFVGQLAKRVGAPPLMGMILAGIFLGSEVSNLILPEVLNLADDLRTIAVMVILLRAGLGLDRDKLQQQSSVALRLGFCPALAEMLVVAVVANWLFEFDFVTGLLLGCVISAESPAVIVPGMLRLKNLGWGVAKGIPDAILTGSALSDVLVLLLFSLLVNFLTQAEVNSNAILLLPLQAIGQVIFGLIIGYLSAKLIVWSIVKQKWTSNTVQDTLIIASVALLIISVARVYPYFSGYLAVMAMGFFLIEFSPPLARKLRTEFNRLWIVAEIVLFVLMGATIKITVLKDVLLPGILLLIVGLICGRTIGWYLATFGSNWSWREKLFLLPGNSAKATVQAAIGAIPLSLGVSGGEIILALAALSILVTAPLGAWAIPSFAPKLLTKDTVDPTKTAIVNRTIFLVVINNLTTAKKTLVTAGDMGRRSNGEIIVVDITSDIIELNSNSLSQLTKKLLVDIVYQIVIIESATLEKIVDLAITYKATAIVCSKGEFSKNLFLKYSVENSELPPILVA